MSYKEINKKKKPLSPLLGETKVERYTAIGGLITAVVLSLLVLLLG
jgi:hypothetical protein